MALFGGSRDISLFRHINRELINEIIDTRCDIFKHSIFDSKENLYGESLGKVFMPGVRVAGLIEKSPASYTSDDIGPDFTTQVKFSFLRDDLAALEIGSVQNTSSPNKNAQNANIFLEVGDIIFWDTLYCEIDTIEQNQYIFGKNQDSDFLGGTHGSSWSVIVETHETRRSKINTLQNVRAGYDEYISGTKIDEQRGGLYG